MTASGETVRIRQQAGSYKGIQSRTEASDMDAGENEQGSRPQAGLPNPY